MKNFLNIYVLKYNYFGETSILSICWMNDRETDSVVVTKVSETATVDGFFTVIAGGFIPSCSKEYPRNVESSKSNEYGTGCNSRNITVQINRSCLAASIEL